MALRILQFGVVFAIGFHLSPASSFAGPVVGVTEIPLSLDLTDPVDVTVSKGQSATLQCDVKYSSSRATLTVDWLHNDVPVPRNDTRRRLQDDGSLYFPKVVGGKKGAGLALTGEYRCRVTNGVGTVLSGPARLRIASFDRDFTKLPSNLTIPDSQPAFLPCDIHSVPAARITWEHNTIPLPHNSRHVPLPSGALLITKTQSSDAGSYRCIATNSLLKKTKPSKLIELAVGPSPADIVAPALLPLDILPNTTVLLGSDITFYCAVTGWPIPTVQWLNEDGVVVSNSGLLELHDVSLHHSGNYTCTAYNSGGRVRASYALVVHQKPYFKVMPKSKKYPAASTVRLECEVGGVPEPTVHWLKNGLPLGNESRIIKHSTELVFAHTFTTDSGIYQCIASNAAGRIWTAAQMVTTTFNIPSPPEDVQCRSYDEMSICLTWRAPDNISIQAYTIHPSYIEMGAPISSLESLSNVTYTLASRLKSSTNYTFYVRLYSNIAASDNSMLVTCETGVKGARSLRVSPMNDTSVELIWAEVSTDFPCNGTKQTYRVQWKRRNSKTTGTNYTTKLTHSLSGLLTGVVYDFRVTSIHYKNENSPWVSFRTASGADSSHKVDNGAEEIELNATRLPMAPDRPEATAISATVINLTWSDPNSNTKYYSICSFMSEIDDCDESTHLITSATNNVELPGLQPDTSYKFSVRAHSLDDHFGPFSLPVKVRTLLDVPSPVLQLEYTVVNEKTACLHWRPPLESNGQLTKYVISYTNNYDIPPDNWPSKEVIKSEECWRNDKDVISTLLLDLKPDQEYMVLVRAKSDAGLGKPTMQIRLSTNGIPEGSLPREYDQKYGIILGVSILCIAILFCASCLVARKQCLKSRALARARSAASNNYYPAVAHYATESSSVQVRLEDPGAAESHEIEHLVGEDTTHVPPPLLSHLDTKGSAGFPNGHINGSAKPYKNGHIVYGNVHITENPRFYAFECNGHTDKRSLALHDSVPYEEDSNSNVKPSKFLDLQRIFENSKLQQKRQSKNQCNSPLKKAELDNDSFKDANSSVSSIDDGLMNGTQLTCLDNSFIVTNHRRVSPILGPNG